LAERYKTDELKKLAAGMLSAAALNETHARACADTLVEADLLGYTTHGIQFLPQYCRALEEGGMARDGEMTLLRDGGSSLVWDADRLSGPWCVRQAVADALRRSENHGVVTALVRRGHNMACLATYLLPVVEANRIGLIFVSTPGSAGVAPPGGRTGRYSTNPMAAGFPTGSDPVLIDMATSATINRLTERLARAGDHHTGEPMLDAEGRPSNDPAVLVGGGGGAIRPLGGDANEHKGFALALMVEALSACLAGAGHAMKDETGASVGSSAFIQVIDPEAFGGRMEFLREMDALNDWLTAAPPRPGSDRVRIPGQRAFAARREQLEKGVVLHPSIRPHVEPVAEKYGLHFPAPLSE
jgi:LDH2 family malate/lactate/ureidoglycolate dehydrogenase